MSADLQNLIARELPDWADAEVSVLAEGWDCQAFALGGRIVVKRPKTTAVEVRLRREAALLALVRPGLTLPVPDLHLVEGPPLWSWHEMLPGEHLVGAGYFRLSAGARHRLGDVLGRFLLELHRTPLAAARQAGAEELPIWMAAGEVLRRARPVLSEALVPVAVQLVHEFEALPPDPLGLIYGQFDGHGWNMAFDAAAQRLNGMYDFADSGIGPLHQDFIYCGLVSFDLMQRVARAYERQAGVRLDLRRIAVLAGMHRLWELAEVAGQKAERADYVSRFADWAEWIEAGAAR